VRCHVSSSVGTPKPGGHPPTTDQCDGCHNQQAWLPLNSLIDHGQIGSTQCVTCHNNNLATGKPGNHPLTSDQCDACHSAGQNWNSLRTPFPHNQAFDLCSNCHNGNIATGKSGNHPPTPDTCDSCHIAGTSWLNFVTPFAHNLVSTLNCTTSGCHTLPGVHCTISAPLGNECSQCHTTSTWTSAQTCNLSANGAPTAVINGPTSAGVGATLTFDGSASFDPDNDPLTYRWTIEGQNYSGSQVSHTFNTAGNITVSLVVNDGQANSSPAQLTVNVSTQPPTNQPPTARISGPNSGTQGARLTFDGGGSSDPDGSISNYSWTIEGQNYNGITASHTFNNPGNVQVRLVVTDNAGANSPAATQNVSIQAQVNQPPNVVISGPTTGCTGVALAFNSNGTRDPENDPLTYQWRVTPAGRASFSSPRQANTSITFNTAGTATVILEVTDTAQNTGSANQSITISAGGMGGMGGGCGGM
jgi:hypothetical protein